MGSTQSQLGWNTEPAESRTFSTVEVSVLMIGFALSGAVFAGAKNWRAASNHDMVVGLALYLAVGLSFSGPIMVSWRERLGRRRPVWGVGESVWFATGLPVQDVVLSILLARWGSEPWGALSFIALLIVLPFVYLTGNPRIEWSRAPLSWSNLVGLLSMALWGLTVVAACWG